MKIAVIGLGNIGGQVAAALVEAGRQIIVADHGSGKAQALADKSPGKAQAATIADAIARGEIIIFGVWFNVIQELLTLYRETLVGKIIVDPSNPIAPDGKGGFKKIIPEDQSSGQILAAMLPSSAKFVKAFGTLSAASLKSGAHRSPQPAVLFYACNDEKAGKEVASLIEAIGFAPVRVGKIDQSIRIEVFGDLHEFGKLGRLVSAEEAANFV
jgi:8-hydroxy-5-deazaflavin:NADPH oxidoreductase